MLLQTLDFLRRLRRSPCGERGLKSPLHLDKKPVFTSSLPVRGAWIEMLYFPLTSLSNSSLPVRGAWIEIASTKSFAATLPCRSPCGERGLKYRLRASYVNLLCRSPCGERGLK